MNNGVYQIVNTVNGMKYIGSGNIKSRWKSHYAKLINGKHGNNHLQNAWNKYGEDSFRFDVIQYCENKKIAVEIEDELLKAYQKWNQWDDLYNIAMDARTPSMTPEVKAKIGAANSISKRNKLLSEEQKELRRGWKHSEESKSKISFASKNMIRTEEHCRKISEAKKAYYAKKREEQK